MYAYDMFKAVILIAFSYVIYVKISGWTVSFFMKSIIGIVYVIIFSIFICKLAVFVSEPCKSILTILISAVYFMIVTNEMFHPIIVNMIVSYAASYVLFLLATIVAVIIVISFYWISGVFGNALIIDIIEKVVWETTLLAFIMEIIFTVVSMKFRKIPVIQERFTSRMGIAISGVILILYSLSRQEIFSCKGWVLFVSGIVLCAAGLINWFKNEIIIAYNNRIRDRMEKRLKTELREIKDMNTYLETTAHRDAKRLPAYRMAVEEIITDTLNEAVKKKAFQLLKELKSAEQEQAHEVFCKLQRGKILPSTGMILLDNVFAHMLNKAIKKNIDFDLIIGGNINGITDIIPKTKLETLAADLIENAIIATEHGDDEYKSILVYLWVSHEEYEIRIDENGQPFEVGIFSRLGKCRITTHEETGGSGIGFMTVFDILRLCNASLVIVERPPLVCRYSKSVSVRFDGKSQKTICSYRAEEIAIHNDGSWIIEDFNKMPWH